MRCTECNIETDDITFNMMDVQACANCDTDLWYKMIDEMGDIMLEFYNDYYDLK